MADSPEKLIQDSRDVINKLNAYHDGVEHLTLKQFDSLLRLAQDLAQRFDSAIDVTSRSQDTLLQMREKLDEVVADVPVKKVDEADDAGYEASANRFGLFSGNSGLSTREAVHVEDFDFHSDFS